MKKAAANLSQQFKVYVPSKRLPIFDQKRMLAKELQDFLHIYKKDTEQLKLDYNYDIEAQKQKDRQGSFNEILLINFLNKCTETQLEEIMSSYMKNSKDSTAFLGNKKSTLETSTNEERKIGSASVGGKKSASLLSTTENITKKQNYKNVTSVAISKSRLNKKNDDLEITENYENNIENTNDSFSSSSNSSLNLSSEVPKPQPQQEKSSNKIIDEVKIQKGIDRVKSAQRLNNNNHHPIAKERVKSTTQTEIDKIIFNRTEAYKSINQSAAAMTTNLQNQIDYRQSQQFRKRKKDAFNFEVLFIRKI